MIAVIFELEPNAGEASTYFDIAGSLAPVLATIEGFVSIERFESLSAQGRFLSLSFWRDEEAVARWRNLPEHRSAQGRGRGGVLAGYRLRVAQVLRDYGPDLRREQAPEDSSQVWRARSSGRES